jgi:integrase
VSPRRKTLVGPSLEIDKSIRHVGRIRHASGLHSQAQLDRCKEYIAEQARTPEGRKLLARMVGKHPQLRADVFFLHAKAGTLHLLKSGAATGLLVPALKEWREKMKEKVAADTYRTRKELITNVERVARPGAVVSELPEVMRALRTKMKGPRQFNMMLHYARAFVRDTIGRRNDTYLDVADIDLSPVKPTVKKHHLSPRQVLAIARAFDQVRADRIAASTAKRGVRPIEAKGEDAIVMALTGMNPKEHQGAWTIYAHHLHIAGTKAGGRDREIPKAFPCALWDGETLPLASVGSKNFWRHFKAAATVAKVPATPYDMRRTFARWMEAAQIERSRRQQYMGHGARDTTDRYERHDVTAYLLRDGEALRAWINEQMATPEAGPKA